MYRWILNMKWYTVLFYVFTICSATDSPADLVRGADESLESYAKRLLQRHPYESNDEFEVRVAFLQVLKPNLPIWHNYDYVKYITVSSENTTRPEYEPKHLDDLIQKKDENSTEYYKRIFVRYSDEDDYQYMERVSILRGILRAQTTIWLNNDFLTYAKPYILECQADIEFRENLKQKSNEPNDEYYKRILRRHQYESNDEYAVRIAFIEPLTPDLPIWENYEYLKHITMDNDENRPDYEPKHMDDIVKNADEDAEQYYTRIFKRYRDESLEEYMKRISILRALLKWRSVWLDNQYMSYVIPHILKKTPGSEEYNPPPGTELPRPPVPFDAHGEHEQVVLKVGNSGTTASNQEDGRETFEDEEDGQTFYLKKEDESLSEFCLRIFAKRPFESHSSYRRILQKMMEQWLEFEMWREKCKPYVDMDAILHYNKFARLKGESKSAYCRRLFEQRFYETEEEYQERQEKEKSRFPGYDHWKQECASVLTDNQ